MRRLLRAIRSQIRYRIILPYLALTLLVMMAGAVIALALVAASQEERLTNQLAQVARSTTDALANRESNHLVFLRQMAFAQENKATNAPAIADAIASGDQAAVGRALDNFYKFALLNQTLDFDRMIAFDDHGIALVDWLRVKEDPTAPPAVIDGTNLSQIPFVKQIIGGQVVEGSDKFAGLIGFAPDPQPYFYTAVPVKQGDKIVGGLMVAMKVDRLVVSLERFSQAAVTTFYDLQGKAIGSSLLDRPELSQFPVPAVVLSSLSSGQAISLFNYDIRQRPYELVYSPLEIAGKHVGYYAVGLSRDFQIESVSLSRNSIIAITMILALGSVLLGYRIARSITVPLTGLVDTAEAVTAGDLERRTAVRSSDELGRLGQAFNQMTEHLLRLYQTSRDLSTTIEVDSVLDVAAATVQSFAPGTEVLALLNGRGVWQYRLRADTPEQLQTLRNLRLSPKDPLLQELAQERAPRLFESEDEPRLVSMGLTSIAGFSSLLMTPLVAQEKLAGVLIFGHAQPHAFEGAVGPTAMATANMAASVLYNAVLFSQVQEEASERRAILQSIGDGVIVCDHQRNIMLVNSAAEKMLNLHDWHIVRRNFSEVPLKRVEIEQDLFGREKAVLDHYQFGDKVLRLSSAPVIGENSATFGEVIVLHDISAEAAVDQAKTDFIKVISHELRTPLTPICGNVELLLRGLFGDLSQEQRETLEQVRGRAEQMKDLVNNIIMVASIEANTLQTEPEPQDLWIAVENAVAPLRRSFANKGLELHIDPMEDMPLVLADREQLRMILTQLLDNARRYTQSGSITVNARRLDGVVQLDISDTGPGIPPEERGRLFTRFHRIEGNNSPERGSGLGLAITRQLVERQGGKVWAASEVGSGSTFSLSLPIASEHADAVLGQNNADATA
jgi:signal transduction histidine kinase/HAMP domain-containing protein